MQHPLGNGRRRRIIHECGTAKGLNQPASPAAPACPYNRLSEIRGPVQRPLLSDHFLGPRFSVRCGSAAYSKTADCSAASSMKDPWLAGGHNGLSNGEDPLRPEDPFPGVIGASQGDARLRPA